MVAMKWTLEEFDRTPFFLTVELMEYFADHPAEHILLAAQVGWKPKNRKKVKRGYENESEFKAAGLLPTPKNTAPDERGLPEWVRTVRQQERVKKMAAAIQGKKPNA